MQNPQAHYDNERDEFPTVSHTDYLASVKFEEDGTDFPSILSEWDYELDEVNDEEWDDPEPLAEYDGNLHRPLYEFTDDDADLVVRLEIGQWVSRIDAASTVQQKMIAELLGELGRTRLHRWLPWLDKQQWTAESLLLFLQFRLYWDVSPRWWEYSFWDWRTHCWYPTRSRYSLSLDDAYDLVHRRLGCRHEEIIDETWLNDWFELVLWQHGFRSFAAFAVFRSGFATGENWLRHIDWYAADDLDNGEIGARWGNDHRLYRYGPPVWFAEQNWFDPREWHDNLGW